MRRRGVAGNWPSGGGGVLAVLVALACAAVFIVPKIGQKPEPSEPEMTDAKDLPVAGWIEEINRTTNGDIPGVEVDHYLTELDDLSARTDDPNERFALSMLRIKTYANSDNVETAIGAGEVLLTEEYLTEEQRLEVYKILVEIYMYMFDDYDALSKYVDLILNSSAWVDDPDGGMGSDYYLNALEFRKVGNEE